MGTFNVLKCLVLLTLSLSFVHVVALSAALKINVSVDRQNCSPDGDTYLALDKFLRDRIKESHIPCLDSIKGFGYTCRGKNTAICKASSTSHLLVTFCYDVCESLNYADISKLNQHMRSNEGDAQKINGSGFICGNATIDTNECPSIFGEYLLSSMSPSVGFSSEADSMALGAGLGAALAALAALLAVAALVYRKMKKMGEVGDSSGVLGATPVFNINDAPNSVPPAGTS